MYAFGISDSEVKNFMNKLLKENCFDDFELRNVQIKSFAKFDIDGRIERKFIENNNLSDDKFFCEWRKIKPYVFNFVKGKIKPSFMKIVISAPENLAAEISENAAALFINFVFENDRVICTTGTAQKNFMLDKSLDAAWDNYVKSFFKDIQIAVYDL